MRVDGIHRRTIWPAEDGRGVAIIDQRRLPHRFVVLHLETLQDAAVAIRDMAVRGAPLIGVTAAYGVALALSEGRRDDTAIAEACRILRATRPTAVNLAWALEGMAAHLLALPEDARLDAAYSEAARMADEDVVINAGIGDSGLGILQRLAEAKGDAPLNILTHCNAGWLATVDWGTALAPIYRAHDAGLAVHVWVDETRPRNQGASLTAWELAQHGVPHTVIADNAGGHLMQRGAVDVCITGTDRTTARGDVCNKIGTYLKALAAHDNGVPFYVGLPSPTIDWTLTGDPAAIPIEERAADEVTHIAGQLPDGSVAQVRLTPAGSPAANPAFDVTPARLVTGLITERGVAPASADGLAALFPDRAAA